VRTEGTSNHPVGNNSIGPHENFSDWKRVYAEEEADAACKDGKHTYQRTQ
jgi:hypothetical protein